MACFLPEENTDGYLERTFSVDDYDRPKHADNINNNDENYYDNDDDDELFEVSKT